MEAYFAAASSLSPSPCAAHSPREKGRGKGGREGRTRSAGAAEHRTGEHPAKRTLAPDRPRATLPLWVTGSASWPRCHHAEPQRRRARKRASRRSPRAARLAQSLAWCSQAASAARSAGTRVGRSGIACSAAARGRQAQRGGGGRSRPPGGQAQRAAPRCGGVSDGRPKGRDRRARCAARQHGVPSENGI